MTPNDCLIEAVRHLHNAVKGDESVLACTQGLRFLILGVSPGEALDPALSSEASRLLFASAPRVAEQTAGRLSADHVFLGLGCANASLSCRDPERFVGLMTFAALLEAELRALHLRDVITAGSQRDLALAISTTGPLDGADKAVRH